MVQIRAEKECLRFFTGHAYPQIFHWHAERILFENASFCGVRKDINFSRQERKYKN